MTWIGLPKTVPPKSSTAIRAAVTDPGPSAAEEGPDMSVSTPILTTSSETCALAGSAAAVDNAASATSHKGRMCSSLKCVLVKRRTLLPRRGSGARKRNIDPAPAFAGKCAAQESAAPPDRNERVAGTRFHDVADAAKADVHSRDHQFVGGLSVMSPSSHASSFLC